MKYTGYLKRTCAASLDFLFLIVIYIVFGFFLSPEANHESITRYYLFINLFTICLYVFLLVKHQTLPGKMLLGIKVVSKDGTPLTIGQALRRYLGIYATLLTMGIGYHAMKLSKKHQSLHDLIANSVVIDK